MGWERCCIPRTNWGENRNRPGYGWKLCPYSDEYKERFRYDGTIYVGFDVDGVPLSQTGTYVIGNSTNPAFRNADYSSYQSSPHTTTSGRMFMTQNPPGWRCTDPNCYYHTTVCSGKCYQEV